MTVNKMRTETKSKLPIVIIVVVLAAAVSLAWYLKRSSSETRRAAPVSAIPASKSGPVRLGAEPPHAQGDTNAPVMLEEFGDFQCPSCATVHTVMKSVKTEFGSRVVVVFREFPLVGAHPNALPAARAAEAAGLRGKFWEMHDLLYKNQKLWSEVSEAQPLFEEYAKSIGLNLDDFRRDLTSTLVDRRITLDQERGRWIGVNSTPTIFINGREISPDSVNIDKLRAEINSELRSAKQ